jgi:hypothetical protein
MLIFHLFSIPYAKQIVRVVRKAPCFVAGAKLRLCLQPNISRRPDSSPCVPPWPSYPPHHLLEYRGRCTTKGTHTDRQRQFVPLVAILLATGLLVARCPLGSQTSETKLSQLVQLSLRNQRRSIATLRTALPTTRMSLNQEARFTYRGSPRYSGPITFGLCYEILRSIPGVCLSRG